jgi:hypothetical protein
MAEKARRRASGKGWDQMQIHFRWRSNLVLLLRIPETLEFSTTQRLASFMRHGFPSAAHAQNLGVAVHLLALRQGLDCGVKGSAPEMSLWGDLALAEKWLALGCHSDHSANLILTFPSLGYENSANHRVAGSAGEKVWSPPLLLS